MNKIELIKANRQPGESLHACHARMRQTLEWAEAGRIETEACRRTDADRKTERIADRKKRRALVVLNQFLDDETR